jgi:microcompartment protein CcmK/EutM
VMLGPLEVLREQLEGLRYVGPLREVPERHYQIAPTSEEGRWATGLAAWDALHRQGELRERTSRWLAGRSRLGSGYELRLRRVMELPSEVRNRLVHGGYGDGSGDGSGEGSGIGDGAGGGRGDGGGDVRTALLQSPQHEKLVLVQLTSPKRDGGLEVYPEDVGVGISQLVPVVAAAFDRQATALDGRRIPVSVVAIEQPELHVHPVIQVGIGDLLIAASKKQQLLIETHSEHIILRIQRRMRETNAKELKTSSLRLVPRKVAVLYLERTKDGTLRATPLGLDEDGKFVDPWPKGFFDERMKELF